MKQFVLKTMCISWTVKWYQFFCTNSAIRYLYLCTLKWLFQKSKIILCIVFENFKMQIVASIFKPWVVCIIHTRKKFQAWEHTRLFWWWIISVLDRVLLVEYSSINLKLQSMAIPVVEFSREGYKIRKVFG